MNYPTIKTPGKFEGCPSYAMQAWDAVLDGRQDETFDYPDGCVDYVSLEIPGVYGVRVWANSDGFVHCESFPTESAYKAAMQDEWNAIQTEEEAENDY